MSATTLQALSVFAIAELLGKNGYRVTVTLDDAVVAECEVLGVPHVLRRVVAQLNYDGETWRTGYLIARPGGPRGPIYQHELVAHEPNLRSIAQLSDWLTRQDAQPFPAKVGT